MKTVVDRGLADELYDEDEDEDLDECEEEDETHQTSSHTTGSTKRPAAGTRGGNRTLNLKDKFTIKKVLKHFVFFDDEEYERECLRYGHRRYLTPASPTHKGINRANTLKTGGGNPGQFSHS